MPATIYLVTGGARSGKSSYAQKLCESLCAENPIYLATARNDWDDNFRERIRHHQESRGEQWTTIEEPLYPSRHAEQFSGRVILVDCLTLWLTNFLVESGALSMPQNSGSKSEDEAQEASSSNNKKADSSATKALENCKQDFDKLIEQWGATFIFVTNEIGWGTHSDNQMTRSFVDAQGWLNQHVANKSDFVIHMVCGQPNMIKEPAKTKHQSSALSTTPDKQRVTEAVMLDKFLSTRKITMDAKGYFMISIDRSLGQIVAKFYSCIVNDHGEVCDLQGNKIPCDSKQRQEPMKTFYGRTAKEVSVKIFEQWDQASRVISSLGHAAYIGRETQRAEAALYSGEYYQQD